MARWTFKRARERLSPASQRKGPLLQGACAWTADPFFRPSVGVFCDGQLRAVAPTRRIAKKVGGKLAWECRYAVAAPDLVEQAQVTAIVCLETGATLHILAPAAKLGGDATLDIHDLIAMARGREPVPANAGFVAFLMLPVSDQLSLLHHCILGRGVDDISREQWLDGLDAGRLTILGIRDHLLAGEEFQQHRMASTTPPLGHWMTWSGLNAIETSAQLFSSEGRLSEGDAGDHRGGEPPGADLRRYLARLALGDEARDTDVAQWLDAHASRFDGRLTKVRTRRREKASVPYSSHSLALGHLLGSLKVGAAGLRSKDSVQFRKATQGDVLFGPYIALVCGTYRVSVTIDARLEIVSKRSTILCEIVYREILFSAKVIRDVADFSGDVELDFVVPAGSDALAEPGFELRLRTEGLVTGEISDVTLQRLSRTGQEPVSAPAVENWLPTLSVGHNGSWSGAALVGDPALPGHLFYGPHRSLLPGAYVLWVSVALRAAPETGSSAVHLDVVTSAGATLAKADVTVSDETKRISLPFSVAAPPPQKALPPSTLEFRLAKPKGMSIAVTDVAVTRLG